MHNDYISGSDMVSLFKAVQVQQEKLCHVGDYIVYKTEELDEVKLGRPYATCILFVDGVWIIISKCEVH